MNKATLSSLLILISSLIGVDLHAQDSTKTPAPIDSLSTVLSDSVLSKSSLKLNKGVQFPANSTSDEQVYSDSLGRWYQWNSIDELLFWTDGLQHFRTSSFIRPSYSITREQSTPTFSVDGIRIFSPLNQTLLTSSVSLRNVISINKTTPTTYQVITKRIIQPHSVTELNAEESGFGYLNVYGSLYTPLTSNQHLDLSLWNKNESDLYERSKAQSKDMFVRYRYQIDNSKQLEASLNYTIIQMSEPDGYYSDAIYGFNFDRFETVPHRRLARSSFRNSLYRLDYFDEESTLFKQLSVFAQLGRRFFKAKKDSLSFNGTTTVFPADTIDVGYNKYGIQINSDVNLLGSEFNYSAQLSYSNTNQDAYSLPFHSKLSGLNWIETIIETSNNIDLSIAESNLNGVFTLNSIIGLSGKLNHNLIFNFGQSTISISSFGELKQQPIYTKYISSYKSVGKELASVQVYGGGISWKTKTLNSSIEINTTGSLESGNYGYKNDEFYLTDKQVHISSTVLGTYTWNKFSFSNQTTATHFLYESGFYPKQTLLWNRTRIYHEDYWFSKASFIRTGFSALFSPFAYSTPTYSAAFNDWFQANPQDQIQGFFRLDYELTARVRALFIYIRWENITQGLLQNGYFETYSYPMYDRRLRFGIKVQFIN